MISQEATGNFACRVDEVVVTTDSPGDVEMPAVTAKAVRAAFANVATLEWAHIPQMFFGAMDGRNDEKVLSTPGGDMGEFLFALHAFQKVSGQTVGVDEATAMLEKYLKVMTKEKFFYETDERAYIRLAVASGCRNLKIAELSGMKRKKEAVLEQIALPEHIGDPVIKFMASNATQLDLSSDIIQAGLAAFHNALWSNTPSHIDQKMCYLSVKGPHQEAAVVNVKVPAFCVDQGLAPMVSQQFACGAPVYLVHQDAAKLLRREIVSVITAGTEVDASEVLATVNQLAGDVLDKFLADKSELPMYTVEFKNSSPFMSENLNVTRA